MFLNAVVIILQEALEAALLLSVLLVLAELLLSTHDRRQWLFYLGVVLLVGLLCSGIYARALPSISELFDYTGQEILNSSIHALSVLGLLTLAYLPVSIQKSWLDQTAAKIAVSSMLLITFLALVREGSEITIYLEGAAQSSDRVFAAFSGAGIGAGIGLSAAVFLYYSLLNMRRIWGLRICVSLLALITGSMASQIVMLLTQADLLPYSSTAWDSSALIQESSITGHVLYALIGYEATPSLLQASCYLAGIAAWVPGRLFRAAWFGETLEQRKSSSA